MIKDSRKEIAALLAALANGIRQMTDEEFAMLVAGEGTMQFVSTYRRTRVAQKGRAASQDIAVAADKLKACATREEAYTLLAGVPKTGRRKFLVDLANILGVHHTKQDTVSRMEERIVESVVGAKIRSEALRTLPLR